MIVKKTLPDGSYGQLTTCRNYEDPFNLELQGLYQQVVEGKSPKAFPADARQDFEILAMLMEATMGCISQ
jgi:hypothetical protein